MVLSEIKVVKLLSIININKVFYMLLFDYPVEFCFVKVHTKHTYSSLYYLEDLIIILKTHYCLSINT